MNIPGSAITWQTAAAILAAFVAVVSGIAVVKSALEQKVRAEETKGWLTGGDSYAHFEPLRVINGVAYFIRHTGKYPAYDVVIRIHGDNDQLIIASGSGLDWLPVSQRLRFLDPPPPDGKPQRSRVEIQARNGVIVQRLRV